MFSFSGILLDADRGQCNDLDIEKIHPVIRDEEQTRMQKRESMVLVSFSVLTLITNDKTANKSQPYIRKSPHTIGNIVRHLSSYQAERDEYLRRFTDPVYRSRQETAEAGAEASSKSRKKSKNKLEIERKTQKRAVAPDAFSFINAPILGGRSTVRCQNCFHLGHAMNASNLCPTEALNRCMAGAHTRTAAQWAKLKFNCDEHRAKLSNILEQLGDDHDGPVKSKLISLCEGYDALDPITGRPSGFGMFKLQSSFSHIYPFNIVLSIR
jgi:hypothetical protein